MERRKLNSDGQQFH